MNTVSTMHAKMEALLAEVRRHPDLMVEPAVRIFSHGGIYAREMHMAAGMTVIGKVHLRKHLVVVLGECWIHSGDATMHFEGYNTFESNPGDQRVIVAVTDTWITTFHSNALGLEPAEFERAVVSEDFHLIDARGLPHPAMVN